MLRKTTGWIFRPKKRKLKWKTVPLNRKIVKGTESQKTFPRTGTSPTRNQTKLVDDLGWNTINWRGVLK